MIDRVLTRRTVAERLSISLRTLERLENAKRLPNRVQISKRRFGYRESDIALYLKSLGSTWETPNSHLVASSDV